MVKIDFLNCQKVCGSLVQHLKQKIIINYKGDIPCWNEIAIIKAINEIVNNSKRAIFVGNIYILVNCFFVILFVCSTRWLMILLIPLSCSFVTDAL